MDTSGSAPSPELFFDTVNAYQRTAALKTALELGLFTAVAEPSTSVEVAQRCGASERGTRILCDYLTILGFLVKTGDRYSPTQDTAVFLNRHSPAYLGGTMEFLASPGVVRNFDDLTGTVGVTAGASAPEELVEATIARLAPRLGVELVRVTDEDEYFPPPRNIRELQAAIGICAATLLGGDPALSSTLDDRRLAASTVLAALHT